MVLIVVAALFWVLADENRSRRLAGILAAWRSARPLPADQPPRGRPPRGRAAGGWFRAAGAVCRWVPGHRVIQRSHPGSAAQKIGLGRNASLHV